MCQAFQELIGIFRVRSIECDIIPLREIRLRIDFTGGNGDLLLQSVLLLDTVTVHVLQFPLQVCVDRGVEQLLKQRLPIVGGSIENLQKISLGDHHRLGELVLGQAQELIDFGLDLIHALDDRPGIHMGQCGIGGLGCGPFAGFLRTLVFGIAADAPGLGLVAEGQLDPRLRPGRGIVRAEGFAPAPLLATGGLAVEGKADGVEDCGLARAGIPGNQEDAILAKPGKINDGLIGIGPKGRQNQLQRFHARSSNSFSTLSSTF